MKVSSSTDQLQLCRRR